MIALWTYLVTVVPLAVGFGVVVYQRDGLRNERDTYRAALWRADPEEARRLSIALRVGLQ